jgi:hypothetical protein
MRDRFEDARDGAFFSSAEGDASLILRMKEDYDGAEPSGNAMAGLLLARLSAITGRDDLRGSLDRLFEAFATRMKAAPVGVPQMIVAWMFARSPARQVVIAGDTAAADTRALLAEIRRRFLPNRVLLLVADGARRLAPAIAGMRPVGGRAAAYVCENYTCQLPVTEVEGLAELLE